MRETLRPILPPLALQLSQTDRQSSNVPAPPGGAETSFNEEDKQDGSLSREEYLDQKSQRSDQAREAVYPIIEIQGESDISIDIQLPDISTKQLAFLIVVAVIAVTITAGVALAAIIL